MIYQIDKENYLKVNYFPSNLLDMDLSYFLITFDTDDENKMFGQDHQFTLEDIFLDLGMTKHVSGDLLIKVLSKGKSFWTYKKYFKRVDI